MKIFEKTEKLGGQWCLAAVPVGKTEFSSFIKWQKTQLERLGVEIQLQNELTVEQVVQEQPDIVIDATGSHPFLVPIKGAERPHVVTAHEVLAGNVIVGKNVVVIGGGLVGAETAEYVAYHGSQVSILEMQPQIAKDGEGASNYYMPVSYTHLIGTFSHHPYIILHFRGGYENEIQFYILVVSFVVNQSL